ncbi:hypothetical protein [Actinomadura macrotermitis]|uniref:Uncharacterized protein n=1 Tax=Actinomadura macrotermitis TaxID=2585200 RepID=A0A7K0C767_9ACTN|nr:hypothetical protein [Actinomadura macrotermitis]MQY09300.1 hypothetical protein [Actinomadura macrotermitis]
MTADTPTRPRGALDQQLLTTGFEVPPDTVSPKNVGYDFDTMPGNRPKKNGNKVYIWESNSPNIPRTQDPRETPVNIDRPDGDGSFSVELTTQSYLLGYAVGPDVENVCATVFVPALGDGDPEIYPPTITLGRIGTNVLTFTYSMPGGSQPLADNDWVGLWENQTSPSLYTLPPKWFDQLPENTARGEGFLRNVRLLRQTPYILGYFKGGYDATRPVQTTLACALTFQT